MTTLILVAGAFMLGLYLGFYSGKADGVERSRYAIHAALSRVSMQARTEFITALMSLKDGKNL